MAMIIEMGNISLSALLHLKAIYYKHTDIGYYLGTYHPQRYVLNTTMTINIKVSFVTFRKQKTYCKCYKLYWWIEN